MRRRRFLSASMLFVLLFAAPRSSGASSSVQFSGSSHASLGQADLVVTAGRRLEVHNLGSSGQDGVSFTSPHFDGSRMEFENPLYSSDAGARLSFSFSWHLVSQPASSRSATLSVTASPGGLTVVSNAPWTVSIPDMQLYRNGQPLITEVTIPALDGAFVQFPVGGSCPTPALSVQRDARASRCICAASWASPQLVVFGGQTFSCDRIEFSSILDEDCDGDGGELRVTAPAASSLSSVVCRSEHLRALDHFVCGAGDVAMSLQLQGSATELLPRLRFASSSLVSGPSSGDYGVEVLSEGCPRAGHGGGGAGGLVALRFAPPSLVFNPGTDDGKTCVTRVLGATPLSASGVCASQVLTLSGSNFGMRCDFSGMGADAESVVVMEQGLEVYRGALPLGGSVHILPTAGGPLGMAINEKGLPGDKKVKGKSGSKVPYAGVTPFSTESTQAPVDVIPFVLGFRCDRVFVVGGLSVTGDEIYCWGTRTSSAGVVAGIVVAAMDCLVRCPNGACSASDFSVAAMDDAGGDVIEAVVSPGTHLSSTSSCVRVPFEFHRTDATPVRAFTATFHLSQALAQCGTSVVEGDYLSRVAGTQMFVVDNGGGSFTVDCGILGPVCGATGDGELFSLQLGTVSPPPASALGEVIVDDVQVRDCSNNPVPASPGASALIPIQFTAPAPVSSLSAQQVLSGNGGGGTTGVAVSWSPPSSASGAASPGVSVYRKGFGNYPFYDNAPNAGVVPSLPASSSAALSSGWTATPCFVSGDVDTPSSRDFLYYCAFARDEYGNESPVSNRSSGALDYHLGDVSNGLAACAGDNRVSSADISLLGSVYGSSVSLGSVTSCLDVGPTTDHSVQGRPLTDGRIGFEDFVLFAINYSVVSAPRFGVRPAAAAANVARVETPALPGIGGTFEASLALEGAGDAQALSVALGYDHGILEMLGVAPGPLLSSQGRDGAVLSSGPGNVDVALLGAGPGLAGSGELARVTFRVKATGDPRFAIAGIEARDAANRAVAVAAGGMAATSAARTGLAFAFPNPFRDATEIRFGLREAGPVKLIVFDVAGRHVRTLLAGVQPAGAGAAHWDGRGDAGLRLAPGAYVIRFEAAGVKESRIVRLVR